MFRPSADVLYSNTLMRYCTHMEMASRQTAVWLPEISTEWLRKQAFERNVSQSQVVRELLEAERAKAA